MSKKNTKINFGDSKPFIFRCLFCTFQHFWSSWQSVTKSIEIYPPCLWKCLGYLEIPVRYYSRDVQGRYTALHYNTSQIPRPTCFSKSKWVREPGYKNTGRLFIYTDVPPHFKLFSQQAVLWIALLHFSKYLIYTIGRVWNKCDQPLI